MPDALKLGVSMRTHSEKPGSGRWAVIGLIGIALVLLLGYVVLKWGPQGFGSRRVPVELQTVLWPQLRSLQPFQLTDQHRQSFDLARLKGKWTFVFFGYTSCPDVCPLTMHALSDVSRKLADEARNRGRVQFVFVSVDPERDRLERLDEYVAYFDKDFLGVTGTDSQIAGFARQLHVIYERTEREGTGQYEIIHTSTVMLVDPQARLVAAISRPQDLSSTVSKFHAIQQYLGDTP